MKNLNKLLLNAVLGTAVLLSTHACSADSGIGKPAAIDAATLAAEAIRIDGELVGAWRIRDRDGEHLLVLTRKAGASPQKPQSARIEKIDLAAVYYRRHGDRWQHEWTIRDGSDCPGLDLEADFYTSDLAFTDVNGDGRTEVSVPYYLFCGGGIDPRTVKVILREGPTKLAVRGESRVTYPGQKPFGGEHQHDKALLAPERAAYKRHLDALWRRVSNDVRK